MNRGRINRRAAVIVVAYSLSVTAFMLLFSLYGYAPLVFYTSVIWIALPLMVYAWVRNRRKGKEDDLW